MRGLLGAIILSTCGAIANAEDFLVITRAGYWIAVVDGNGVPTMRRIDSVIDLTGENPGPVPPDSQIVRKVKDWATEVSDPTGAAALSKIYEEGAKLWRSGELDERTSLFFLSLTSDRVLEEVSTIEQWEGFRGNVTDLITAERQRGTYNSGTLDQIAKGCEASLPAGAAINWDAIIRLIELILPLILKIIAGL